MMDLVNTLSLLKHGLEGREFKSYFNHEFPVMMKAFRIIDDSYNHGKRRKGFNLVKRENRKKGFVYYVRYSHNGRMLPTKWNTHTNILEEAEQFARENRERLVEKYLREHDRRGLEIFTRFYEPNSEHLICEEKRNRPLSDTTRRNYHSVITKKFLPFLHERHITSYEGISVNVLGDFQDYYLATEIKPQTVNDYLKAVKRVLHYLVRKGYINTPPYIRNIPVHPNDRIARGCYELKTLKGVFDKRWRDQRSCLLCLLVYTTGMRNSEIREIGMNDIISMGGCRFIDIKRSKTVNGVRLVPLHEKVYQKLRTFGMGKNSDGRFFGNCSSVVFSRASDELARIIRAAGKSVETGITFYSGRHFWKTLMNSEELGEDIEEIFMGHKVSNNVAKLYNHRDKQGKERVIRKAKKVFAILDKFIFAGY
jgi:integrase